VADSRSFEEMRNSVHREGTTLFDHDGMKVPCILVKQETFDSIAKACYGKPMVVDSNLNILHDDRKHVFVEIVLKFAGTAVEQRVMLYANETIEFFEHLAGSGIIAIAPAPPAQAGSNIFMVQLPRKDAIERAVEMIRSYMR
jgi:hypothetical protein